MFDVRVKNKKKKDILVATRPDVSSLNVVSYSNLPQMKKKGREKMFDGLTKK